MPEMFQPRGYYVYINPADVVSVSRTLPKIHKRKVYPWFTNLFRRLVGKKPIRPYYVRDERAIGRDRYGKVEYSHFEKPTLNIRIRDVEREQIFFFFSLFRAEQEVQELRKLMEQLSEEVVEEQEAEEQAEGEE